MASTHPTRAQRSADDRRVGRSDRFSRQRQPGDDRAPSAGVAPVGRQQAGAARAIGWFSVGLGMAELVAPEEIARLIGIGADDHQTVVRAVGLREIVTGLGILTQARPTPWLWARVGGDAIDFALLRSALDSPATDRPRATAATAAVVGCAVLDAVCSARATVAADGIAAPPQPAQARAAVTIHAAAADVYRLWDGFRQLPRFMSDFATIELTGDRRSHWRLAGPAGIALEWDVEITDAVPNERIAWRTAGDSSLSADGQVRFRRAPRDQGTEVIFDARLHPPGGEIGKTVAQFFASALGVKIGNDLRRCKQLIELGEIVQSDDSVIPGPNPAQPPRRAAA